MMTTRLTTDCMTTDEVECTTSRVAVVARRPVRQCTFSEACAQESCDETGSLQRTTSSHRGGGERLLGGAADGRGERVRHRAQPQHVERQLGGEGAQLAKRSHAGRIGSTCHQRFLRLVGLPVPRKHRGAQRGELSSAQRRDAGDARAEPSERRPETVGDASARARALVAHVFGALDVRPRDAHARSRAPEAAARLLVRVLLVFVRVWAGGGALEQQLHARACEHRLV
mmetsp:Transcript_24346/g.62784  ORF Transcript_24346/g.62784 Transcript_24346/m.62784 type:complete len:228 (+) Transcript_24346:97-780(+)